MSALKRRDVKTLTEVTALAERGPLIAKIAGSVSSKQERKSANGNRFPFVQLSDPTGLYEVTLFSDALETARDFLEPGQNVVPVSYTHLAVYKRQGHGGLLAGRR